MDQTLSEQLLSVCAMFVLEVQLPDKTMDQTLSEQLLSVCAMFARW
jgi:hypothetical protein